ncbi:hypothetical protein [Citrobacter sp. RHB21-C01]|uniref:hypothetical protein n=1 Tax=Citrobacter sp. RHB21-C01 TaxID=2742622 RepID=UPI0034D533C2
MSTLTKEFTKEQLISRALIMIRKHREMLEINPDYDGIARDVELFEIALASLEAEPVADVVAWSSPNEERQCDIRWRRHDVYPGPLYTVPPAQNDYFSSLVAAARIRADKAMLKFPQPNYVLNKVAEESGEVIKEVIHYTEGSGDWNKVEYELIDNLAMLIRLVIEGDQVIGFTPPYVCRAAMLQDAEPVSQPYTLPTKCWCHTCRPVTMNDARFVVCPKCGNKRCPHANDHRNACTGSNEPGQEGSAYPAAPQQEVK